MGEQNKLGKFRDAFLRINGGQCARNPLQNSRGEGVISRFRVFIGLLAGQSVPEVEDFHCRRLTARFDENVKLKAKTKKGKKKTAVTNQRRRSRKRRKSAVVKFLYPSLGPPN